MICRFCNGTGLMPYPDPATGDLPVCPDCPVPSPPAAPELPEGFHARVANQLRAQLEPVCGSTHAFGKCWKCADRGDESEREPEMPEAGEVYFCIECGGANVTRCDEDGCCVTCGVPLVTLVEIRTALEAGGLHIVDAKDRAVLEAMSQVPGEMLHNSIAYKYAHEASKPVAQAEIARREKP